MPRNDSTFRAVEKEIPDIVCHDDGLLGIVKVQMPNQCGEADSCRILQREREHNIRIIQNTITAFGNWAQQVAAPAIILFPEFSVTEEAADWLQAEMSSTRISPNTLIVLGMEQVSTLQFLSRISRSDSQAEYAEIIFPPNIDLINTAVILVKNNAGNVFCYYQPKCCRSDYESQRQFTSNTVYKFTFGIHHLAVSICSDFFLHDDTGALVGSVMQDIDTLYQRPSDHRLDLILLIQKNPSPLHPLYDESIKCLFYNRPHRIQTTDTIICAVNGVDQGAPGKFGKSNVCVMRRGRPPKEFEKKNANKEFAWCSLKTHNVHLNEDIHYVRWRLRSAGAIAFVLVTDRRPWPPASVDSMPVRNIGLHRLTDAHDLEAFSPVPEVYELQEVLYDDFQSFINETFQTDTLRYYFAPTDGYERLLNNLFPRSPRKIIRLLLSLHKVKVPVNCDHWEMTLLEDAFRHFLLTLRLLGERYDDLNIVDDQLYGAAHRIGVMDCERRTIADILKELRNPANMVDDIDLLLMQRISELYTWNGVPTSLDVLNSMISISNHLETDEGHGSIARAPSPQIVDVGSVIFNINQRCADVINMRSVLNEFLQSA